jgi:pyrophosphate--fructose-6-phosphate 1-phosphotransferase
LKIPGYVDVSFGFDTACRTYSELIGNLCVDGLSSGKYWHFIRLMGRAASNITLECALATHPNLTLIGEEVAARHQNLSSITEEIVNVIAGRAAAGKNYGVVLVPEGLIEFVPEMNLLLAEINELLAHGTPNTVAAVADALSLSSAGLFNYLPPSIKQQLLADRDPHGNVQVSLIETEKLLADLVQHELDKRARAGNCPLPCREGRWPTSFQFHFFGYEGRCALPCDFDTVYCYALGMVAATLLQHGCTGLMSSVTKLDAPVSEWECAGVPLTAFFNIERRHGKDKPVIKKALVELHELPFRTFMTLRAGWALADAYRNPGPVQLHESGDTVELCHTLALEYEERACGGAAAPHVPVPPTKQGEGALEAYKGLLEGLLGDGSAPSAHDLHRLLLFRLAHKVTDALHARALESVNVPLAKFAAWEAALQQQQ